MWFGINTDAGLYLKHYGVLGMKWNKNKLKRVSIEDQDINSVANNVLETIKKQNKELYDSLSENNKKVFDRVWRQALKSTLIVRRTRKRAEEASNKKKNYYMDKETGKQYFRT